MIVNEVFLQAYAFGQSVDFSDEAWRIAGKWAPPTIIAAITAIMSVAFQIKRGKVMTRGEAIWSVVIAFGLSMVIYYVASLKFDPFYANAMSVGAGLFGKEAVLWIFLHWDAIMAGIFGRAGVKIRKRNR